MVNVIQSLDINHIDYINDNKYNFALTEANKTGKKLILLYVYYLPKFPTHGYKVGMATCKPGEIFWDAIADRIKVQKHELALDDDKLLKYGQVGEFV